MDTVRFRRKQRGRWHTGTVTGPADGGAALWVRDDGTGASRCLRLDQVEIPVRGPKGATVWVTAASVAGRPTQLTLG